MQQTVKKVFFELLRCEIKGDKINEEVKSLINPKILALLFKLSKQHDLAHLLCDALDKNRLLQEGEIKNAFYKERNLAVFRHEQMQYEFVQIATALKERAIEFIPLKGAVIREFYPQPWMRTSCDIDILIKPSQIDMASNVLAQKLNYKKDKTSGHDVHLFSQSGVHLELHYKLNEKDGDQSIVSSVWDYTVDDKVYQKRLTGEFFYLYHLSHMANHFKMGGCGVRSLLDLWVMQGKIIYDETNISQMLEKENLLDFARAIEGLISVWFEKSSTNDFYDELENYILFAGMYGDMTNRVAVAKAKENRGNRVLLTRVFLPYDKLKIKYPKLAKHRVLYPYYTVK